jgi:hypothetical protein
MVAAGVLVCLDEPSLADGADEGIHDLSGWH